MRRQIVFVALAAMTSWAAMPEEADAGHRHRCRHHRRAATSCCTPEPVSCCSSQYGTSYASAPAYEVVTPQYAPATSGCCGSTMSYGAQSYGNQGYGGTSYPPEPMPADGYQNQNQQYEAQRYPQDDYNQGNAPASASDYRQQGNLNQQGNVGAQGGVNARGNLNTQGNANQGRFNAQGAANTRSSANLRADESPNVPQSQEDWNEGNDVTPDGIGVGKADMDQDFGR